MNRLGWLFLLGLAVAPASAQVDPRAEKAQVRFCDPPFKQVPATVRQQAPRGFATLDCKIARAAAGGEAVLLHLYALARKGPARSSLDVFVRRGNRYRRINSVRLVGVDWAQLGYQTMPVVWLDAARRRLPIVPVAVPSARGAGDGEVWLLTFRAGLAQKPVVQKFEYFWGEQAHLWLFPRAVDERGRIVLSHLYERGGGGPDLFESRDTRLFWNGSRFAEKK